MKQTPAESYRDKRHGFKDFADEQRTFRLNERVQNVRQVCTETDIDGTLDSNFSLVYLIVSTSGLLYSLPCFKRLS